MTLRFLTAGESHGPALIAILEGIPAGLDLSAEDINQDLARRQHGFGSGGRMKIEHDTAQILSGVMEGKTTGAPIAVKIENRDHTKWVDRSIPAFTTPRPGHADLTGVVKYGLPDLRPALERASARETAARVAVGAICRKLLLHFNIFIGGYVVAIGGVTANLSAISLEERIQAALNSDVSCPDPEAAAGMRSQIQKIMRAGDTLGGLIEIAALGLPPGLGSYVQWDRRLEARLAAAVMSVQAIKGMEIGAGFENARLPGTQVHDAIQLDGSRLSRPTNRCGGLEGGITTGQPLIIRTAMKPIATTITPQKTVDLASAENVPTQYERSDFCPVPRAVVILETVVAFVLMDALLEKLGGDSLNEMLPRFTALRQLDLNDLKLENTPHIWWPHE